MYKLACNMHISKHEKLRPQSGFNLKANLRDLFVLSFREKIYLE